MTRTAQDWKPRSLPGGIYCSPACGARCRRKDYERANSDAAALCKRLGPGWKPRVWENMGWHWIVQNGDVEVRPDVVSAAKTRSQRVTFYSAWYQGLPSQIISGYHRNVRAALRDLAESLAEATAATERALQIVTAITTKRRK